MDHAFINDIIFFISLDNMTNGKLRPVMNKDMTVVKYSRLLANTYCLCYEFITILSRCYSRKSHC